MVKLLEAGSVVRLHLSVQLAFSRRFPVFSGVIVAFRVAGVCIVTVRLVCSQHRACTSE